MITIIWSNDNCISIQHITSFLLLILPIMPDFTAACAVNLRCRDYWTCRLLCECVSGDSALKLQIGDDMDCCNCSRMWSVRVRDYGQMKMLSSRLQHPALDLDSSSCSHNHNWKVLFAFLQRHQVVHGHGNGGQFGLSKILTRKIMKKLNKLAISLE